MNLLASVTPRLDLTGRPLAAANAGLPLPSDPIEALWQVATTLREHRGDGHIAALVSNRIGGTSKRLYAWVERPNWLAVVVR